MRKGRKVQFNPYHVLTPTGKSAEVPSQTISSLHFFLVPVYREKGEKEWKSKMKSERRFDISRYGNRVKFQIFCSLETSVMIAILPATHVKLTHDIPGSFKVMKIWLQRK